MTNDDRNGVSAEPEKIDPEEQLPDQPDPELPDLTRLYKQRCRDERDQKSEIAPCSRSYH